MNILIHGILTKDSNKTIGKLRKYVKSAYSFNYGYIGVLGALWKNKSIAKDLAKLIKGKSPTIYAHSNGNAVAVIAAEKYGAKIENLICIGAALNRNIVFPKSIKNILVLSTKRDKATKYARFFDSLPIAGCLVPDVWGSMGTDGHIGSDPRVTNIVLTDVIDGHSDYFSDEDLLMLAKITDDWLLGVKNKIK